MTNKVLLGLIAAVAIGIVVVGSTDEARQQPAAAITAFEKKAEFKGDVEVTADAIAKTANDSKDLSTFATVAEAVGISTLLKEKGGVYTVFAPTNDAFKKSYGESEGAILASETRESAVDLLRYHIVSGKIDINSGKGEQILTTLQGGTITITHGKDGVVYVNGSATILSTEQTTSGSVVYVIDQVLNPKDSVVVDEPTTPTPTESTGKVRMRIICKDNGDGTITYWDEAQNGWWIFWGPWHQTSEAVTVNHEGKGCAWLPGWPKDQQSVRLQGDEEYAPITKDDSLEFTPADRREVCTDTQEGTSIVKVEQKKKFLFFWDYWTTISEIEQKNSCSGK